MEVAVQDRLDLERLDRQERLEEIVSQPQGNNF
jgi:hypothetical protein